MKPKVFHLFQLLHLPKYTHSNGKADPTLSDMTTKEEQANPSIETDMEGGTLISAQPKSIVNHAIITPNFNTTTVDPIVDVRVEEIEAANMEK
jgi:hypothetical protein